MAQAWSSKTNQSCWNCSHFQRYDESDTPTTVYGECRRIAPVGERVEDQAFAERFSFITIGDYNWCGNWKKTSLVVPPAPVTPTPPTWPDAFTNWVPWNVKEPLDISCWNCNHFQAGRIDPSGPDDTDGDCRKNQPPPITLLETVEHTDWLRPSNHNQKGVYYWCGEWEMATHTIPPIG